MKNPKPIKGIPLDQLLPEKALITTEDSVLKFFREHPKEAFSIEALSKGGFSTNIRKIVQQLVNQDKLVQDSHRPDEKEKWEYVYYLRSLESRFHLKKSQNGWVINEIQINGSQFPIECEIKKNPPNPPFKEEVVHLTIFFPNEGEGRIYFDEVNDSDEVQWRACITSVDNEEYYDKFAHRIDLFLEQESLGEFEVDSPGKRTRLSQTKSMIESDRAILWFGDVGFLFIIDPADQSIRIYPRFGTFEEEGEEGEEDEDDEEEIDYFNVDYGVGQEPEETEEEEFFDFAGMGEFHQDDFESDLMKEDVNFVLVRGKKR